MKNQASMERLRVLYKGRKRIPNIREAVFTNREKRSTPLITSSNIRIIQMQINFFNFIHRPDWKYKTRSRYIVKPSLVHEVDVHNVLSHCKTFSRWTSTMLLALLPASKRWSFLVTESLWHTSGLRVELFQAWRRSRRKISTWFEVSLQSFWIGSTR